MLQFYRLKMLSLNCNEREHGGRCSKDTVLVELTRRRRVVEGPCCSKADRLMSVNSLSFSQDGGKKENACSSMGDYV